MNRFDTIVSGSLGVIGGLSILLGLGTILYASFVIRPQLGEVTRQGVESLNLAERGFEVLAEHSDVVGPLNPPQSNALSTLQALPTALEQSANLSHHAGEALSRSATTVRQIEDDLGILLPNNALQRNADALETSAKSLQGLSPVLYRLHEETDTVAADLTRASKQAERLQDDLQQANLSLDTARAHIEQTRNALQSADLEVEITRLIGVVGGFFILIGVLLMAMAGLWRRLALLTTSREPPPSPNGSRE